MSYERYSPWISNNRFALRGGLICRASRGVLLGYSLSMSAKRFRWSAQACSGSNGFAVSWYLWQWNKNLYVAMFRAFLMVLPSPPSPPPTPNLFWYTIKIINCNHLGNFCLLTLYKDLGIQGSFRLLLDFEYYLHLLPGCIEVYFDYFDMTTKLKNNDFEESNFLTIDIMQWKEAFPREIIFYVIVKFSTRREMLFKKYWNN